MRLERELRHKDLELGKALFDMKNTDINELKMAVEVQTLVLNVNLQIDLNPLTMIFQDICDRS